MSVKIQELVNKILQQSHPSLKLVIEKEDDDEVKFLLKRGDDVVSGIDLDVNENREAEVHSYTIKKEMKKGYNFFLCTVVVYYAGQIKFVRRKNINKLIIESLNWISAYVFMKYFGCHYDLKEWYENNKTKINYLLNNPEKCVPKESEIFVKLINAIKANNNIFDFQMLLKISTDVKFLLKVLYGESWSDDKNCPEYIWKRTSPICRMCINDKTKINDKTEEYKILTYLASKLKP